MSVTHCLMKGWEALTNDSERQHCTIDWRHVNSVGHKAVTPIHQADNRFQLGMSKLPYFCNYLHNVRPKFVWSKDNQTSNLSNFTMPILLFTAGAQEDNLDIPNSNVTWSIDPVKFAQSLQTQTWSGSADAHALICQGAETSILWSASLSQNGLIAFEYEAEPPQPNSKQDCDLDLQILDANLDSGSCWNSNLDLKRKLNSVKAIVEFKRILEFENSDQLIELQSVFEFKIRRKFMALTLDSEFEFNAGPTSLHHFKTAWEYDSTCFMQPLDMYILTESLSL